MSIPTRIGTRIESLAISYSTTTLGIRRCLLLLAAADTPSVRLCVSSAPTLPVR